eukprot:193210-Amorphochlora_amoeboformis.AAC.1
MPGRGLSKRRNLTPSSMYFSLCFISADHRDIQLIRSQTDTRMLDKQCVAITATFVGGQHVIYVGCAVVAVDLDQPVTESRGNSEMTCQDGKNQRSDVVLTVLGLPASIATNSAEDITA